MMREILFRGKNDRGEWIEGFYIKDVIGTYVYDKYRNTRMQSVIPETVGQYTGLTDKNGKKIFEGDIIQSKAGAVYSGSYRAVVEFKDGAFLGCGFLDIEPRDFEYCEVVGNIHDVPGLVEGGE